MRPRTDSSRFPCQAFTLLLFGLWGCSASQVGEGVGEGVDAADGVAGRGECVPYADDCPAGQYCQYVDDRTRCVEEGDVPRDERCDDRCQRGSICMSSNSFLGKLCQKPCSIPDGVTCDLSRHTCFTALDDDDNELWFGVCRY